MKAMQLPLMPRSIIGSEGGRSVGYGFMHWLEDRISRLKFSALFPHLVRQNESVGFTSRHLRYVEFL